MKFRFLVFAFLICGALIFFASISARTTFAATTATPQATLTPTVPPWMFTVTSLPTLISIPASATPTPTRRAITPGATLAAPSPSNTIFSTPTTEPSSTATPTARATNTIALARYPLSLDPKALAIESLRARPYGGGTIRITKIVADVGAYQRVLIEYPSDGLRITGTMNIPRGNGPFPVVILDHGYFKPTEYKSGDGTNYAADLFARRGYLTLASDYRCYGGSPCVSNPLDVGYAVDILNLINSLSSLSNADSARIGIWGHSMGGGVTARVIAVSDQIKVAALYAAVSADDEVHYCWLVGCKTPVAREPTREPRDARVNELDPDFIAGLDANNSAARDPMARLREIFARSSPARFLQYVSAPVIIHHGEKDDTVPIQWSIDLADALNARGKPATLYTYPTEGHVFVGLQWRLFMERTLAFFDKILAPRESPITADVRVQKRESSLLDPSY
ncbi:MAG: alpha/beta fold hydrolase [Chloroflexi bacterium]|nr:alpha/beta fold hydrolase [Chloroflexota bacterium]